MSWLSSMIEQSSLGGSWSCRIWGLWSCYFVKVLKSTSATRFSRVFEKVWLLKNLLIHLCSLKSWAEISFFCTVEKQCRKGLWSEKIKIGETIPVLLERLEDKMGEVVVSASKAKKIVGWEKSTTLLFSFSFKNKKNGEV